MNVARSEGQGTWWHVAESPTGVYIRLAEAPGVTLPRDQALRLLEGLTEVLGR